MHIYIYIHIFVFVYIEGEKGIEQANKKTRKHREKESHPQLHSKTLQSTVRGLPSR